MEQVHLGFFFIQPRIGRRLRLANIGTWWEWPAGSVSLNNMTFHGMAMALIVLGVGHGCFKVVTQ